MKQLFVVLVIVNTISCSFPENKRGGHVKVSELEDPEGFNPYTTINATAHAMFPVIYQKLLAQSFSGPEILPVLAESRPEMTTLGDSMIISWRLRPEAKWDNGEPITARDVEFSFKAIMCPGVNSYPYHSYIDFIRSFRLYDDDPLRFDMLCNKVYMRAEYSAGAEVYILPRYVYDPEGLLSGFTYSQILTDTSLARNDKVARFAEQFNSESTARDTNKISGSGAYRLVQWETGQRIVFERKKEWWGDQVEAPGNMYFEANPDRITHEVIPDFAAAVTALKAGKIDVMRQITAADFEALIADTPAHVNLVTAPFIAFSVMPMNMRNPKLADKRTRQALSCLMNYDRGIKDVQLGYAQRVVGPVHPTAGEAYNSEIPLYPFDPDKARSLLAEAGWRDSNGDGVLDQVINGRREDLELELLVNNAPREQVALIFQSDCKKAGVKINIRMVEGMVMSERMRNHDFEMAYTAWLFEQAPTDYMQVFGTPGWNGGDNFTYFGNASTDLLIATINKTIDEKERARLLRQLQEVIHEEAPYIFLWSPVNRLAIAKRFSNTYVSVTNPGYWVPGFVEEKEEE